MILLCRVERRALLAALNTAGLITETAILALDSRVRRCAMALGLRLLPSSS